MNLTPQIKAQAIAAAIYTTTGIQPEVIYPEGKNPRIVFSRPDVLKMRKIVSAQLKKKADVDINLIEIVGRPILKKYWFELLFTAGALFFVGYLQGQLH